MAIIGFVDGMEGGYVVGWAANPPDTASCLITITDDDGKILATGKAARRRPDLSRIGCTYLPMARRFLTRRSMLVLAIMMRSARSKRAN